MENSPMQDYNERGLDNMLWILKQAGFRITGRNEDRIYIIHPAEKNNMKSGSFHFKSNRLYMFFCPTLLEPRKAYSPADVFTMLECRSDKKDANIKLIRMGFGTPQQ